MFDNNQIDARANLLSLGLIFDFCCLSPMLFCCFFPNYKLDLYGLAVMHSLCQCPVSTILDIGILKAWV